MAWNDYGYPDVDRSSPWKSIAGLWMAISERYGVSLDSRLPQRFMHYSNSQMLGTVMLSCLKEIDDFLYGWLQYFPIPPNRPFFIKHDVVNPFDEDMYLKEEAMIQWSDFPELLKEDIITVDSIKYKSQLVPYFKQRYRMINLLNRTTHATGYRVFVNGENGVGYFKEADTASDAWNNAINNFDYSQSYSYEYARIHQDRIDRYTATVYRVGFFYELPHFSNLTVMPAPMDNKPCSIIFYCDSRYYGEEFFSTQYQKGWNVIDLIAPYVIKINDNDVLNCHMFGRIPPQPPINEKRACSCGDERVIYYPDFEFKAQE